MDYFLYSVDLPFSGIKLFYREINAKEQILLGKIAILYPPNEEHNNDFITALEKILINCVENKEDFYKINILDYILFLTKLRILSVDNTLDLEFQKKDENNLKNKCTVNLETFMKNLYEVAISTNFSEEIEFKNIKIKLNWPNIKTKNFLLKNKKNILPTISEFIEKISIDEKLIIELDNFTEKEKIINKFPIALKNKIGNKVLKAIKQIVDKNLFDIDKMDWFRFNFYDPSYFYFLRLMFSCNLKKMYQEYYILATKNINLSYVDNMSIADKKIYCFMIEEEFKARAQNYNNGVSSDEMSLSDLINEFKG